jgi:hypothetical protein
LVQILPESGSGSALDPDPHSSKMLDPDPHIANADPKHWRVVFFKEDCYYYYSTLDIIGLIFICFRGSWARDQETIKNVRVVFLLGHLENDTLQVVPSLALVFLDQD